MRFTTSCLKKSGRFTTKSLTFVYRLSFRRGDHHRSWECGNVCAIFKCRHPTCRADFRLTSLLTTVGKLLERVSSRRLVFLAESRGWISEHQLGFQYRHSTVDITVILQHRILEAFRRNERAMVVFLDLSKTFERVWQHRLRHKSSNMALTGCVPIWIRIFLADRKGRVIHNRCTTDKFDVRFGCPQGAMLSSVIFALFVNDVFDVCRQLHCFADDCWAFFSCRSVEAAADELSSTLGPVISS